MNRKERRELAFKRAKKEMKKLGVPRRQLAVFMRTEMAKLNLGWNWQSPHGKEV